MALWLVSHMTAQKLQSHWSAQIPFPGPIAGLCPNSPDPFPSLRVGSGDETSGLYVNIKINSNKAKEIFKVNVLCTQ